MLIFPHPQPLGSKKKVDRERKSLEHKWVAHLFIALKAGKKAFTLNIKKITDDFISIREFPKSSNPFRLCLFNKYIFQYFPVPNLVFVLKN